MQISRPKSSRALPIAAAVLLVFLAAVFIALSAVTLPFETIDYIFLTDQTIDGPPDQAELFVLTSKEEVEPLLPPLEGHGTPWRDINYSRSILILAKTSNTSTCWPLDIVWIGRWSNRVLILADRRWPLINFRYLLRIPFYVACDFRDDRRLLVIPRDGLSGRVRFDLVDRVVPLVSIERDLP